MFLRQCQRQRKCFLSERELKKALRDTLTRAAWLGPVIFDWFVLSMRMQVILDSSFARPGLVPIWGGKKGEFRDWTRALVALGDRDAPAKRKHIVMIYVNFFWASLQQRTDCYISVSVHKRPDIYLNMNTIKKLK